MPPTTALPQHRPKPFQFFQIHFYSPQRFIQRGARNIVARRPSCYFAYSSRIRAVITDKYNKTIPLLNAVDCAETYSAGGVTGGVAGHLSILLFRYENFVARSLTAWHALWAALMGI